MPEPDPRSDEQLVEAANGGRAGERAEAFTALYNRHRDWAVALARRFTRDDDLALDVAQEAFIHLLGRFPGFELRARLRTYLYPVIRSIAATHLRKRRPTAPADALASAPAPDNPGNPGEAPLAAALAALPEAQREVLLMRAVDEMAVSEIAVALDIPEGTVKSRLHHALRTLRGDERARGYFEP